METAVSLLWTELNHSQKGEIKYIFILDWNLYPDSWNGREQVEEEEKQKGKKDKGEEGRKKRGRREGWGMKMILCVSVEENVGTEAVGWNAYILTMGQAGSVASLPKALKNQSYGWPCQLLA